jgi:peptide chain release factor 2
MKYLAAKLADRREQERKDEMNALAGDRSEVGFGSQIRSYTLHPDQRIKDHRTNLDVFNVDGVLDGDLDELIEAYLRWNREENAGA